MIKINISTKPKMGFYELNIMFEDESRVRFSKSNKLNLQIKKNRECLAWIKSVPISELMRRKEGTHCQITHRIERRRKPTKMEDEPLADERAFSFSFAQSKTLNLGLFGRIQGFACLLASGNWLYVTNLKEGYLALYADDFKILCSRWKDNTTLVSCRSTFLKRASEPGHFLRKIIDC
ncbi:hypothetical protein QUF79_00610 [Fictibacillus enclensis]|uniref:hypothetical protein n=1 Tax=Fictibacillus enclensis TaxID=1017270 RepID=UPI0025A00ACC|nr:hypothetical protein [Fictibacillus enclensis]MDM5196597.1 hypothetical protein [Fictibacillus enclensis]